MTDETTVPAGWGNLFQRAYLPKVIVACLAVWLHAADEMVITTLMASVIGDIGGADRVFWNFTLYETGSVVASATGALMALRYGLGRVMAAGALTYGAGCVLAAIAPAMEVMLAGRLLQGLGGGLMVALAFMLVARELPKTLVARALAAISVFWGASAFVGPLIGGLFAEIGFWRGAFWLFAAKAIILAALIPAVLGDGGRRPRDAVVAGRPPYVRLALLALGVTAVASAGIDPAPLRSIALLATGIGLVALFLLRDAASAGARMLPADLFRRKTTTQPGLILLFLFSILLVPLSAYGPVLMIGLHGISALEAGYVIATVSFGWSGATILLSGLPPRYEIPVIGGGFVLVALAVPALALVLGSGPVWVIALVGALDGAGFGMAWTYLMKRMTENQDAAEGNRIAGAMSTISRMGYALGAGLTGLAANLAGFADVMDPTTARSVAFWIFAALVPVALGGLSALALFVVRSRA